MASKNSEQKVALVAGGTGLVGSHVIQELATSNKYKLVKVLVRKPMPIHYNSKIEYILFDYDQPIASALVADDVYCCLGTTMKKAGSKEAFYKVDFEYPFKIAQLALAGGAKRFAIITAMGANKKSLIYYNRVKGEIEDALSKLSYEALLIFRPSLLLGNRSESRFGEKAGEVLSKLFSFAIPKKYQGIEASKVAKAMVAITASQVTGKLIYESDVLQEF